MGAAPDIHERRGYDIIGDVHGHAAELEALLARMGYERDGSVWRHSLRQVVFVGDLVDRGPAQLGTIEIARAMVEAGAARIVMGNHEYNALAYATPNPAVPDEFLRRHTPKNTRQHQVFLDEVGADPAVGTYKEVLDWFRTIPLWLELRLGDARLRVVHACWSAAAMEVLAPQMGPGATLTAELLVATSRKGTPEYDALETLLKGPEIDLPDGLAYHDKEGNRRARARYAWWRAEALTYKLGANIPTNTTLCTHGPGGCPRPLDDCPAFPGLPDAHIPGIESVRYHDPVPLVVGHYWRSGPELTLRSPEVACVDYSAGGGGPLVAYRWSGEQVLDETNLVSSRA